MPCASCRLTPHLGPPACRHPLPACFLPTAAVTCPSAHVARFQTRSGFLRDRLAPVTVCTASHAYAALARLIPLPHATLISDFPFFTPEAVCVHRGPSRPLALRPLSPHSFSPPFASCARFRTLVLTRLCSSFFFYFVACPPTSPLFAQFPVAFLSAYGFVCHLLGAGRLFSDRLQLRPSYFPPLPPFFITAEPLPRGVVLLPAPQRSFVTPPVHSFPSLGCTIPPYGSVTLFAHSVHALLLSACILGPAPLGGLPFRLIRRRSHAFCPTPAGSQPAGCSLLALALNLSACPLFSASHAPLFTPPCTDHYWLPSYSQ